MKKIYFLLITCLFGFTLLGQETITLNWKITDDNLVPLVGVSVWKKGTHDGTSTDVNGNFSIKVTSDRDVIIISYLGFETLEIPITNDLPANWIEFLPKTDYTLQEVIITGLSINESTQIVCGPFPFMHVCWVNQSKNSEEIVLPENFTIQFSGFDTKIFPIPTPNAIFLQQETPLGQLDLYNLSGQKLQSFNFSDQLNASIDLSDLPSGTYLLRSSNGWVEKVVLQKL
ncbi:carboxypeptidase-like regulatory domain-containing protein [Haliscomenobacter hydrossis]|uniref:Secretion system C-terminal sorting domain-containing protein n=1 Tax=Haliscomenobacter hydrossis (strain ATCC 27775 / DSM 1100 / LMG 10767 / O) TaxID=760192 RepID=F4KW66_HALH1|nr:carboxypeptidase-like regulatory domain-containing protein [Haliscomenobacter hydrossis]AEE49254.1 hypothetical protein Halhy_1359 [Haliscomenobacter hydrossis DSM 1100]